MSILFNEIWINEEMLPKYTRTHTYIVFATALGDWDSIPG